MNEKTNQTSQTNIISVAERFGKSPDAPASGQQALQECPDWLTPLAKKHWPELAESLSRHGLVNELDRNALAMYCSQFARFIELDEKLDEVGMVQMTKTGYEAETGTFTAWKSMLKNILSWSKQLGLTPPARVAIHSRDPNQSELEF